MGEKTSGTSPSDSRYMDPNSTAFGTVLFLEAKRLFVKLPDSFPSHLRGKYKLD